VELRFVVTVIELWLFVKGETHCEGETIGVEGSLLFILFISSYSSN